MEGRAALLCRSPSALALPIYKLAIDQCRGVACEPRLTHETRRLGAGLGSTGRFFVARRTWLAPGGVCLRGRADTRDRSPQSRRHRAVGGALARSGAIGTLAAQLPKGAPRSSAPV